MRKSILFVVSLSLLLASPVARATADDKYNLEETTDFNTAVALATSDFFIDTAVAANTSTNAYELLQKTLQAHKNYEARIGRAAEALSNACLLELVTAEAEHDQCMEHFHAVNDPQQPIASTVEEYAHTGDRSAFEANVREITKHTLQALPRACWYAPVPRPVQSTAQALPACPTEWSAYDQCEKDNKVAIVAGKGSINNLTRKSISLCYRPACPRY